MTIQVEYKLGRGQHWYTIPTKFGFFSTAWQAAYEAIELECVDKETETISLKFRKVK